MIISTYECWGGVMRNFLLGMCLGLPLVGCSIHPQTEDFSREYLPDIVYRVRCETRDAIRAVLPTDHHDPHYSLHGSGITFDFEFTLTEDDNGTTKGGVQIPISLGTFTIGWDAGLLKQRKSVLKVIVSDAFKTLLTLKGCDAPERANFKYPITGHIGIEDAMRNFVTLYRQNTGLFTEFSDDLTFKTDIKASVKPEVRLMPKINRLITAEASVVLQRVDSHKVKLSFDPPDPVKPELTEAEKEKVQLKTATRFLLIDPQGKAIDPRTLGGGAIQPFATPEAAPPNVPTPPRPSAPRPATTREIEQRSLDRFRQNEDRRFQQQILEQLRRQ